MFYFLPHKIVSPGSVIGVCSISRLYDSLNFFLSFCCAPLIRIEAENPIMRCVRNAGQTEFTESFKINLNQFGSIFSGYLRGSINAV